jgi:hypothetical protein
MSESQYSTLQYGRAAVVLVSIDETDIIIVRTSELRAVRREPTTSKNVSEMKSGTRFAFSGGLLI